MVDLMQHTCCYDICNYDLVNTSHSSCTALQDSDEDAAGGGGPGGKGHKADKRKLEEAVEREKAKKVKAKEDADKKVGHRD